MQEIKPIVLPFFITYQDTYEWLWDDERFVSNEEKLNLLAKFVNTLIDEVNKLNTKIRKLKGEENGILP